MRHRQTRRPLIQYQLSCIDDFCQLFQERLDGSRIRDQVVYDLCPRLVQALVPDARRKELDGILEAFGCFPDVVRALVEHGLPEPRLHEIHFVYEAEDFGARTAFVQCADDVGVGYDIGRELARLDIEDEDEDGDGAKDVVAGLGEVVFDEAVLTAHRQLASPLRSLRACRIPATVPQVEHQIPHELDVAVLHIDGCAESPHVLCNIVAKDNTAHGGFARSTLAHEQHLALLLALRCGVHLAHVTLCAGCEMTVWVLVATKWMYRVAGRRSPWVFEFVALGSRLMFGSRAWTK
jgi:hypothetical protein